MRRKWIWLSTAAVAAGVGGGALSLRYRVRAPAAPVRPSGAAVIASAEVTLTGKIRPQHLTPVAAAAGGIIDAFLADVGQDVYTGQVLARIGASGLESAREAAASAVEHGQDQVSRAEAVVAGARLEASRADADLARARMAFDRVEKNWARQQTLYAAGATPRLTYEKAEHEYEGAQQDLSIMDKAARAAAEQVQSAVAQWNSAKKALADRVRELDEAQANLQAAEVRSPVDGFVVARNGEAGKPVQEGGDLFQIATDLYALEATVEPEPAVLKHIRPGQQALVLVLDLQSAGIPGDVKEIQGGLVVVEFGSTTPAIKPGMQAAVRLKLE
ncbi:MAG: efflux RND transporter periplasmic adaptor subunit [Acidobacteriia bacterium]|nr:efflux RND transporter periplasmic adaptor subunit [Terriglobia bacterium]